MLENLLAMVLATSTGSSMVVLPTEGGVGDGTLFFIVETTYCGPNTFERSKSVHCGYLFCQKSQFHDIILFPLVCASFYAIKLELLSCLLKTLYLPLHFRSACRQSNVQYGAARFVGSAKVIGIVVRCCMQDEVVHSIDFGVEIFPGYIEIDDLRCIPAYFL